MIKKRGTKTHTNTPSAVGKSKIQQPAVRSIDRSESIFCAIFFEFTRLVFAVRIFMQKYFVHDAFCSLSHSFLLYWFWTSRYILDIMCSFVTLLSI